MIQIAIVEHEHEIDCMEEANQILSEINESDLIKIDYQCSHFQSGEDQIYSFSICIVYRIDDSMIDHNIE